MNNVPVYLKTFSDFYLDVLNNSVIQRVFVNLCNQNAKRKQKQRRLFIRFNLPTRQAGSRCPDDTAASDNAQHTPYRFFAQRLTQKGNKQRGAKPYQCASQHGTAQSHHRYE